MQQGSNHGFSLGQHMWSRLLCCDDIFADLLLEGLDVDTVLQDGKYYFWSSLCELQRVCTTQGKSSKSWHCVCGDASVSILVRVHLPREWHMKYPVIPGHACGSAFKSLVIPKEKPNRNSSCFIRFSNACVKLACVRLARYFLPAGVDFSVFLPPFLLALFNFYLDFWEPVQFLVWKTIFWLCIV